MSMGYIARQRNSSINKHFCKKISLIYCLRENKSLSPFWELKVLICKILNSLHQRMLAAKLGWNLPSGSTCKGDDIKISSIYFCCFIIISPWKRTGPLIWTNLSPHHPRILCAKFGWNLPSGSGEDFLNFVNVFLLFGNYLPMENSGPLTWKKNWIPLTQGCFVQSLVEISPVVQEKKIF